MTKNYDSSTNNRVTKLLFLCWMISCGVLFGQTTYSFTNAGATGSLGPTQTQVNNSYSGTTLDGSVQVSGGIQTFTIPCTGPYRITALGAAGGTHQYSPGYPGGMGVSMRGDFVFTAGTVLRIIVGQMGGNTTAAPTTPNNDWDNAGAGGGGGSFVFYNVSDPTPLIAAGGGGGGGRTLFNQHATTLTTAMTPTSPGGPGGIGGNGGGVNSGGASYWAGGGAGWLSDGTGGNQTALYNPLPGSTGAQGGRRPLNGAFGGGRWNDGFDEGGDGGFGGGGGGGSDNMGSGGGGGYSGGGGAPATNNPSGGGGGSYNSGTNQVNTASVNIGHGRVIIELISNLTVNAITASGSNPLICAGNSLTLTTNATSNYTWSTNNTSTTSIVVSPPSTTTYSILTGVGGATCSNYASITVTVSPGLPVLSIANPSSNICLGRTVSLTASGAITYTWVNPGVVNGQTFTPSGTQVYTVQGQNGCGITIATTTITVSPLPVTAVANPTLVCEGYPSTLTAVSAVNNYTWQPGPLTNSAVVVAPLANTIYTVTASDGTCSGTQTLLLTTKTTPTITTSSTATRICVGTSVTISASGAGAGGTYSWNAVGGSNASFAVAPLTNSLFTVFGTNSLNCTSSANQVVVVDQPPVINITNNTNIVCSGATVALSASGGNSYQWVNGPPLPGYTPTVLATTVYTVIGFHTTNSCTATRTIEISAVIPNVVVTETYAICEGNSATLTATGANNYVWGGVPSPAGTRVVSPISTTLYSLVATTTSLSAVCVSNHTALVTVNPNPTVNVTSGKNTICRNETHTLTASGALTYSWSTTATTTVITVKPTVSTFYTVTGTDANGCVGEKVFQAMVNSCNGLAENQSASSIIVYPNPGSGKVWVSATSEVHLKLINALGQEISSQNLSDENSFSWELSDLKSGVYFLVGENEYQKVNQKIVIEN